MTTASRWGPRAGGAQPPAGAARASAAPIASLAAQAPGSDTAEVAAARRELLALDPDAELLDEGSPAPPPRAPGWGARGLALSLGSLGALVLLGGLWGLRRRRALSLAQVAAASPELHPALTYQLGGLRHELLKHRVAAVGPALATLRGGGEGTAGARSWTYLLERLYGGTGAGEEPLSRAWAQHVGALHRALGLRDELLRGDRRLREADRAVRRIAALERPLLRARAVGGDARLLRRLHEAREALLAFDAQAADLCQRLSRTEISEALLREVTESVRAEYGAGRLPLDALSVAPVPPGILVEVYRADLLLVLRNLVRNAVRAAGAGPAPRRVGLDAQVELQPTGEERVRLRVQDSSPETFDPSELAASRPEHGLGLVVAALQLYRGGIAVEPGEGGYEKAVCVWLFRALGDGEGALSAATPPGAAPG